MPKESAAVVDKISDAIKDGAPKYNAGEKEYCLLRYLRTAKEIQAEVGESFLDGAIVEAEELHKAKKYGDGAWVLRFAFDEILEREQNKISVEIPDDESGADTDSSGWQDEREAPQNDAEKGQALSDTAHILRSFIQTATHSWVGKSYANTFRGSDAVDVLTSLKLSPSRKIATEKLALLWKGGFVVSVSHQDEKSFRDGARLYQFSSKEELQASLDRVVKLDGVEIEGSEEHLLMVALTAALEEPEYASDTSNKISEGGDQLYAGVSTRCISKIPSTMLSEQQQKGQKIAAFCAQVEPLIEVEDRKYHLKTYEQCFVGSDAVSKIVEAKLVSSREEATEKLMELSETGLIYHVLNEHHFKDGKYFYRFSSAGEVKKSLDAFSAIRNSDRTKNLVQYSALINRYKHIAGMLNITSILNDFYGCEDESGWDISDLENWRHNMKRWGFGRRSDQDDEMVNRLSPLLHNIDPDTWDVSGDPEWESPYGILAQIALFDQIPRSAFRGTPNAFKWDELAKRATRVALEKGYFETAYKSTLNQFLILLPLEHSEDWEDQKLGVSLLLSLLSTVAVMDEGYSDYEIVKRLEFSKRLSVAFLEHAQVIAKFKRYPHRNRAIGRTTTLEERIWLASDLVPRWAKSQNPEGDGEEGNKKVVRLPAIPLKRLTRGR